MPEASRQSHAGLATRSSRERIVLAVSVALPLFFWPGLDQPFSSPKAWLLLVSAGLVLAWRDRRAQLADTWRALPPGIRLASALWATSFVWSGCVAPDTSLDALLLGLAGPAWCLAVAASGASPRAVLVAHATAALAVGSVALAQAAGIDPIVLTGHVPQVKGASERLRVYATLGNPNFLAAWLAMTLPGTVAVSVWDRGSALSRALGWCALLVSVGALAATGSRGGALGAGAGLAALALFGSRRGLVGACLAVAFATTLILTSTARPVRETLEGRLYIWKVTAPHALERPAAGFGPGTFELLHPTWERDARAREPEGRRFRGPQQHAHDDYLESLVERGVPGLLAALGFVLGVVITAVRQITRRGWDANLAAAAAGIVAVAVVAVVDFPLARPAEVGAAWTLTACVGLSCASPRNRLD